MEVEDITSQALCGVMEKALIAEGVSPAVARLLAERACQPVVRKGTRAAVDTGKKAVSRATKSARSKYKRAFAKVKGKYQTRTGRWKKNGFKNAVRAAHRLAKDMR